MFKFQRSGIFPNGRKKKPAQNYKQHLIVKQNESWLFDIAKKDVCLLRLCLTRNMFNQLWKVIKQAWIEKGETKITTVFGKSYANDGRYSEF